MGSPRPGRRHRAANHSTRLPLRLSRYRRSSGQGLRRTRWSTAPVRFLVDTGASTVALSPADARAAGINPNALLFDKTTATANGVVRVAPVLLREIRIEQLLIENVPAVVDANLNGSLLGMSFLSRLKSFEMREGALTFSW